MGALHGMAALHERADVSTLHVRAGALCVRAGALCVRAGALHVRAGALHVRAGALHVRAGDLCVRDGALHWWHKIRHHYHIVCTALVVSHFFHIHRGDLFKTPSYPIFG